MYANGFLGYIAILQALTLNLLGTCNFWEGIPIA